MFVLTTTPEGRKGWRPVYIGSIRNDYVRRTLCVLFTPLVWLWTVTVNIFALIVFLVINFVKGSWGAIYSPTKGLFTRREFWHRPRSKSDDAFNEVARIRYQREQQYPTETDAIKAIQQASFRLNDLGWTETPPEETGYQHRIDIYELGTGGVNEYCFRFGNGWAVMDETGDCWPLKPTLFKVTENPSQSHIN